MANSDPVFGIHPAAMQVQRQRMELIASNIANADTPGYQAKDVDFRAVLAAAQDAPGDLARTQDQHLGIDGAANGDFASVWRVPVQPSVDGNTVDVQIEQAQFADAALRYQASLNFMDGRIKSLITALTGQ
ncbi:MAG: flagellar basal body rod protein FlgB [Nevskiales bacterium]|nr:flagellar basal body rod protein FlgB [Nevskiales bacterium]